jgi:protein disulfide-isomerase A6
MMPILNMARNVAVLLAILAVVSADGLYTKSSPVLQVTAKSYDSLIAQSNHTSIIEFYAPWCGHCQNLKPAYEKVAKNLAGLAKVAAVNCDEEMNKPLCSQQGIQGFPTLKIVKPGSKPGKPIVEDYQGARTAKAIVDAVVDKIPNHVKRMQDGGLDKWLSESPHAPKAMLFSEKGTTSALIRSLAVDFLGVVDFAQIRSKETAAVEKYGVTRFPTLVVLPGADKEPMLYTAEMKKTPMLAFISQVASPNPDPAVKQAKPSKAPRTSSSTASSKFSKASAAHKSADLYDDLEHVETIILGDTMTESPMPMVPQQTPAPIPEVVPAIPILATAPELTSACLAPHSGTCILVILPIAGAEEALPQAAVDALASSAELADKHAKRKASIFPFYGIPGDNEASKTIRDDLGLEVNQLEVLAINMKRGWYRVYAAETYDVVSLEDFVDRIRLGDGVKQRIPEAFFETATDATGEQSPPVEPVESPVSSAAASEESVEAPEPELEPPIEHGEL